jgi:hypothetical protein
LGKEGKEKRKSINNIVKYNICESRVLRIYIEKWEVGER